MKIMLIGSLPPPINGVSITNSTIYNGLLKNGHSVYTLKTDTSNEVKDLSDQGKLSASKLISGSRIMLKGFFMLLKKNPDVVYCTPGESYFGFIRYVPLILFSKVLKKPVYLHFHGEMFLVMYKSLGSYSRAFIKKNVTLSNGIIVLGQTYLVRYKELFPSSSIFVCENCSSSDIFINKNDLAEKQEKFMYGSKVKLLYFGNLLKTKGVLDLLSSLEILDAKKVDYELNICGAIEPMIENEFNRYLEKYKSKIIYHGIVKGKKKRMIFQESHIFCLPTYMISEAQPISIMEAMAAGNVVITTSKGGILDIFEDGHNGFLCEPMNPESISCAILKGIDNFVEISKNNSMKACLRYTEELFIKRIETILSPSDRYLR